MTGTPAPLDDIELPALINVFLGMRDGGHQERGESKREELERRDTFHLFLLVLFSSNTMTASSSLVLALHFAPK